MTALSVKNLGKEYPAFTLQSVSFTVEEGKVVGLVGANGAGKSTTIKGILGLIEATGEASVFSLPASGLKAKSLIGYAGGGFRFYPQKKVGALAKTVSSFYPEWKEEKFRLYCERFNLLPEKKIAELSEGMKVKMALALALSHGARLLILDEPTSGLDPLSREEFCDVILELVKEEGISVLFSTHITSDLERIADEVVLLSHGQVLATGAISDIMKKYLIVRFDGEAPEGAVGVKAVKSGSEALLLAESATGEMQTRTPTLDEIFIHLEYERRKEQ